MAAPTIDTIRSALVTAMESLGSPWTEDPSHPEFITQMTDNLLPRSFSVVIPETLIIDPKRRTKRQANEAGMLCESAIRVRWVHRLRVDGVRADLTALLEEEESITQALTSVNLTGIGGPIIPEKIVRELAGSGSQTFHVTSVSLTCKHLYALSA